MKRRTIIEAAIEALKRKGEPLSTKDIYDFIIEQDLYRFNAEDPVGIVKVQIRRHCEGVDFPTAKPNKFFQILKDGRYWIRNTPIPGLNEASMKSEIIVRKDFESLKTVVTELREIHLKHTKAFKKQIINQLKQINPRTFEIFAKRLLEVYGFEEMNVTRYGKDGGLDGHGQLKVGITHLNVAFQCKRWNTTTVSRMEIDKFRGAIQGDYEQGIIFTTSNFSKEALGATRKRGAVPIILIDGSTLVDIMINKKFGVDSESILVYVNALDSALMQE
jgi:restriction system protein